MGDVVEGTFDVPLDEPDRPLPAAADLAEGRVHPPTGPESMAVVRELGFVVRLQQHPEHLLDDLVAPGGDAQGPLFPTTLRDVGPACRGPPKPLIPEQADDP